MKKAIYSVVVAVLLALGGWVFSANARVSVVEVRTEGLHEMLGKMDKKLDDVLSEQRTVREELRRGRYSR